MPACEFCASAALIPAAHSVDVAPGGAKVRK
jgi:hypothetical protein